VHACERKGERARARAARRKRARRAKKKSACERVRERERKRERERERENAEATLFYQLKERKLRDVRHLSLRLEDRVLRKVGAQAGC